jgi:phosphonate transport system substrate-binding protein
VGKGATAEAAAAAGVLRMVRFARAFSTTTGRKLCIALAGLLALVSGCSRESATDYAPQFGGQPAARMTEYVFAVHPLHNPERLFAVYGPIVEHLNVNIPGIRFRLEASRDYAEFEKKLYARKFQFALPNPYQTVKALDRGYRVFGKMGDDENFRGIILVRRDSGIRSVADLKGKSVSYPAPTALAATMMPQYYLHTHGLDVNRDIKNVYVGSQESSIMNVYLGNVAAAATWPVPWQIFVKEQPAKARELEIKWQTETLPNNSLMARDDVPQQLVEKVAGLLFSLPATPAGRRMLERIPLTRFEPATGAVYEPVRAYVKRFNAEVRQVD